MDRDPPCVLQPGAEFRGSVHLTGPARIDGSIDGEVIAADRLWIGEQASIKARVTAPEIIVDGTLEGALDAERVELRPTARVRAEVRTPKLILAEGAVLEGRCSTAAPSDETRDEMRVETRDKTPDGVANSEP